MRVNTLHPRNRPKYVRFLSNDLSLKHRSRLPFQIEMETAIRKFDRLQTGLEIPPFRNEPIPTGFLRKACLCTVRVVGRGGCQSELRTVRRDARCGRRVGTVCKSL